MYKVVTSPSAIPSIAQEIADATVLSLDLETTGLDPHSCSIRLLSLNTGKGVYVIDCFQTGTPTAVIDALRDSNAVIVGQGLKFDQKFLLHHWGLRLGKVFDCYRASNLIYNGAERGHNLWDLYRRELKREPTVLDLGGSNWAGPLSKEQLDYAADDVIHLPRLRDVLRRKLISNGLTTVAQIEFGAVLPEAAIELAGFPLDTQRWRECAHNSAATERRLRSELLAELPNPSRQTSLFECGDFNLASPEQLLQSLNMLGCHPMGKDEEGNDKPSTAEMALAMQVDAYPVIKKILEWREYAQLVKSFGLPYLDNINKVTGRIHTSYYPFTGAGRYASSKPNLQQIPRRKDYRKCFHAPPGKVFVIADYSQIELRIAAEISNDQSLIGIYQRGEDAHTKTASVISGLPMDKVTKEYRSRAKPVNFGLIYGMKPEKLAKYSKANYGVNMSLDEATTFSERYFSEYRGVAEWHREIFSRSARARGVARTISGRLRYLGEDAYNEHSNTPVQGSGADGLKRALRVVYDRLDHGRMVHMVHDEIIVETDDDPELIRHTQHLLETAMVDGMQPLLKKVPVVAEGGFGHSWADKA